VGLIGGAIVVDPVWDSVKVGIVSFLMVEGTFLNSMGPETVHSKMIHRYCCKMYGYLPLHTDYFLLVILYCKNGYGN